MMYQKLLIMMVAVLLIAGCTEVHPNQDKIDMIDTKSGVRMSGWNVQEFKDGYVVKANSFDDSQISGMKTGSPIWYVEGNTVYWVNGKAKSVSYVYNEAPEKIQDAILNPELVAQRDELLNEFDIVELNENFLFDYDEEKGTRALCDYGGHDLYRNPGLNRGGSTYKFQVCDKQIQIKILKEATHKESGSRYYFVDVDGNQGWMYSGDLDKYNELLSYEQKLEEDLNFRKRVENARRLENAGVEVETENANWDFKEMNKIINYKQDTDTICLEKGFGLYEKLPDYDSRGRFKFGGKKFATANPCEKTLVLKVLKEATHKEKGTQIWLVEFEGQIGWVDKKQVTNAY